MNLRSLAALLALFTIPHLIGYYLLNAPLISCILPLSACILLLAVVIKLALHWRMSTILFSLILMIISVLFLLSAEIMKFLIYTNLIPPIEKIYYLYILAMVPGAFGISTLISDWKNNIKISRIDYILPLAFAIPGTALIVPYFINPDIYLNDLHVLGCGYLLLLTSFFAFLAIVIHKRFSCSLSSYMLVLGILLLLFAHCLAPLQTTLRDLAALPLTLGYVILSAALLYFMRESEGHGAETYLKASPSLSLDLAKKVKDEGNTP